MTERQPRPVLAEIGRVLLLGSILGVLLYVTYIAMAMLGF